MALDDMGTRWIPSASQMPVAPSINDLTGLTAGSLNADLIAAVDVSVFREVTLQVGGAFVGTLTFQGSLDNVTFYSVVGVPIAGGALTSTVSAAGLWIIPVSYKYLRIRMTAYTSGTATGQARSLTTSLPLDALISSVAISGNPSVVGNVAHDGVDSGAPVKVGGIAYAADPVVVSALDRANAYCDQLGKLVTVPLACRALISQSTVTLTTTTETTILTAAGAGIYLDISWLVFTNTSATAVRVDIRPSTGGGVLLSLNLEASKTLIVDLSDIPIIQTTANNNWTVQLSAAVTDVRITAGGAKRSA